MPLCYGQMLAPSRCISFSDRRSGLQEALFCIIQGITELQRLSIRKSFVIESANFKVVAFTIMTDLFWEQSSLFVILQKKQQIRLVVLTE